MVELPLFLPFKQMYGSSANSKLGTLISDKTIKAFLLKAMTDRKSQLENIDPQWYALALYDKNQRVQLEAVNGLVRLENSHYNNEIFSLTKNFSLPYLANSELNLTNYEDVFSVKSYAKNITIPTHDKKKIYLLVKQTVESPFPFVLAEPKFIDKKGKIIKVNKFKNNPIVHKIEGNFSQNDLPIYFTKTPVQAQYGLSTKGSFPQSLFIELNVP